MIRKTENRVSLYVPLVTVSTGQRGGGGGPAMRVGYLSGPPAHFWVRGTPLGCHGAIPRVKSATKHSITHYDPQFPLSCSYRSANLGVIVCPGQKVLPEMCVLGCSLQ